MNTPGANAVAVAEHTFALMLAMVRGLVRADITTREGKWEKKSLMGSELRGKTLGIIGLGRIGVEVAKRASSFGMTVLANDPAAAPELEHSLNLSLVTREEVFTRADFLSLHVALTPKTHGMIDKDAIESMKKGVRIINCARGELIVDTALADALQSGHVAGAALDVFTQEPPVGSPLLSAPNLLATPHIAGSTTEAQEAVGIQIARQILDYLKRGAIQNAVNVPSISDEQFTEMQPWLTLAERLGSCLGQTADGELKSVDLLYEGRLAEWDTTLLRNSALVGLLNCSAGEKANIVNAANMASTRGIRVEEARKKPSPSGAVHNVLEITVRTAVDEQTARGTVSEEGQPRLLHISGINVEAPLNGHLLTFRNYDVPGVIGSIGTVLGKHKVNIANMSLGRAERKDPAHPAEAIAVIAIDDEVPAAAFADLKGLDSIRVVKNVRLNQ